MGFLTVALYFLPAVKRMNEYIQTTFGEDAQSRDGKAAFQAYRRERKEELRVLMFVRPRFTSLTPGLR